jgi:hypothetical protein
MEKKRNTGAAVVIEATAQAALRRAPATGLAPEEEKVLRMRLGASPPRGAPLQKAVEQMSDLEIELLAYEIEAHLRWRAHRQGAATPIRATPPRPASRTKEKIVRALRKKV